MDRDGWKEWARLMSVLGAVSVVAILVATCEGCTPTLQVTLDRVPGGERATVSVDGVPAVAISSATTLTAREL